MSGNTSDHVFAYINDLCSVTTSFQDHLNWLKIVLTAINKANLQINLVKSEYRCSIVKYLGFYVVDADCLNTVPDSVQAINEYSAPTNLKQFRRYIGMIS